MLNAQPIGQNKRWRDDVWTMKYLPRFRWDQLSEQVGALPMSSYYDPTPYRFSS